MTEHLSPTHPDYEEYNRLQEMYALLINRILTNKYGDKGDFVAGKLVGNEGEIELEATRIVILAELEKRLGTMQVANMEEVWGEFINSLNI